MSPVVVSSWVGAQPVSRNRLIEKVCRLYGFDSADTELAQVALDMLDETINDMNMAMFEFNKTTESSITLIAGTPYVTLSTQFYRESMAYLVDSAGKMGNPLDLIPWVHYQRWYGDSTITGQPEKYSLFNSEQDGRVYLYPTPDAATVAEYTATVEYYQRIPLVSEISGGASLEVPREIESALVYGAQKRIAMHLGKLDDVQTLAALEGQALERLKRVDKTHPDMRRQFVLADFAKGMGRKRADTDFIIKI